MEFLQQIVQNVILGVVQGLTEFLPVSSSGHLTIAQHLMGMADIEKSNLFLDVMLHLGTLFAVFVFYRKLIWRLIKAFGSMVKDIFTGKFSFKKMDNDRNLIVMLFDGVIPLFLLFIPIPGTGMKVKDYVELFSDKKYFIVVGFCLLVTSLLLALGMFFSKRVSGRRFKGEENSEYTGGGRTRYGVVDAILVGITQAFATLPGISRSGSTLAVGQMRGINKQAALDYTFVLGIPAIIGAAVLQIKDVEFSAYSGTDIIAMACGMISAAVVGYLAIKLFKWLLKTDKMIVFVIYTAVVGLFVVGVSIYEMVSGSFV